MVDRLFHIFIVLEWRGKGSLFRKEIFSNSLVKVVIFSYAEKSRAYHLSLKPVSNHSPYTNQGNAQVVHDLSANLYSLIKLTKSVLDYHLLTHCLQVAGVQHTDIYSDPCNVYTVFALPTTQYIIFHPVLSPCQDSYYSQICYEMLILVVTYILSLKFITSKTTLFWTIVITLFNQYSLM